MYHIAQICLSGHMINNGWDEFPDSNKTYCDKCGAKTITACPSCGHSIKGYQEIEGFVDFEPTPVPSYCDNCGKPYPWTQTAIEAIESMIMEDLSITDDEKNKLASSIPDLLVETPKTILSVARFRKALSSMGKFAADGIRQLIIEFGCEYAKKNLFL